MKKKTDLELFAELGWRSSTECSPQKAKTHRRRLGEPFDSMSLEEMRRYLKEKLTARAAEANE